VADAPGAGGHDDSAAQMFSDANALRKAGRLSDAEQAYRRLQRAHAGSSEAAVSHVLLGRLLLRGGRAEAACAEFERYLHGQRRGNLAEEALQGDAMCMRALGRPAAERSVWQTLLARFPGSIYADAARQRLKELEGADGSPP
jgi:TolA-binding protein